MVSVLHLQGMPGSGKSEIVRKLGAEFPYTSKDVAVKWHIQCSDDKHNIKTQLDKLQDSMVKHEMLAVSEGVLESVSSNMRDNRCKQYVNLLSSCDFPILIIVEDPKKSDQSFLSDFLACVVDVKSRIEKFHICDIPQRGVCRCETVSEKNQ